MPEVTKRERLEAALNGELLDRPPVVLWRHFPVDDQEPEALAASTALFQSAFDFDFVKVTPASSFCLLGWGVEDEWRGNPEGTREYTNHPIKHPAQWRELRPLDPANGSLEAQRQCLLRLRELLGPGIPFIQTVLSPLAQAKNLAGGEQLMAQILDAPSAVLDGLRVIAQTTASWVERLAETGIAGIFYAVQHASNQYFDREGYRTFGEPFDLGILEQAEQYWLNVLHLHGGAIHFDLAGRYPVQVVNWHDRETAPDLAAGKRGSGIAVCGGVRRETLLLGTPGSVQAEALESLSLAGKAGVILGTGCVTPVHAPRSNLQALRDAVNFA
jgi:uroporphyrinogen decarboxylase